MKSRLAKLKYGTFLHASALNSGQTSQIQSVLIISDVFVDKPSVLEYGGF